MGMEFSALRQQARDRRDKLISRARAEYVDVMLQLAELEEKMTGKATPRGKPVSACIDSLIPKDQPFSTHDILQGLQDLDPTRVWRKGAIVYHIGKLCRKRIVRRVRKANVHKPALYIRYDAVYEPPATTAELTLEELLNRVLWRPLNPIEVAVAVTDAGYQTLMRPRNLRGQISRKLKQMGYKLVDGKWTRE